jgi:hypothetical protein
MDLTFLIHLSLKKKHRSPFEIRSILADWGIVAIAPNYPGQSIAAQSTAFLASNSDKTNTPDDAECDAA